MPEQQCEKLSLSKYFAEQDYFNSRPANIPGRLFSFFGYKKPVTVLFRQRQGYHVYAMRNRADHHDDIFARLYSVTDVTSVMHTLTRARMDGIVWPFTR